MDHAREVLDWWFGRETFDLAALRERMKLWFSGGASAEARERRDREVATELGTLSARALVGVLDSWASSPNQLLALILLLDQAPRHIHRGTPRAYAGDERAVALTLEGLMQAADATLDPVRRIFFYMPLQHSERREVQAESVQVYERLLREAPAPLRAVFEETLKYARQHADVVNRFGRFPHRNAVLRRTTTDAERAWLAEGGTDFGG